MEIPVTCDGCGAVTESEDADIGRWFTIGWIGGDLLLACSPACGEQAFHQAIQSRSLARFHDFERFQA